LERTYIKIEVLLLLHSIKYMPYQLMHITSNKKEHKEFL